jgi:hypothetical protein
LSWGKIGTFLLALPPALLAIMTLYTMFIDRNKLEADLSYQYASAPRLFTDRFRGVTDSLDYNRLYDNIKNIGNGALSHEQINQLVDLNQAPYRALFDAPFGGGPEKYPVRLLIELRNTGNKVIKDVHIKLPAKGVVQIRDDSGVDAIKPELMSSIEIPAIVQNGEYTIWINFAGDLETLKGQEVNIGYSDGVAKVRVSQEVIGLEASMARYGILWVVGLLTLFYLYAVIVYLLLPAFREVEAKPTQS